MKNIIGALIIVLFINFMLSITGISTTFKEYGASIGLYMQYGEWIEVEIKEYIYY